MGSFMKEMQIDSSAHTMIPLPACLPACLLHPAICSFSDLAAQLKASFEVRSK
jgi:hypothetical protein